MTTETSEQPKNIFILATGFISQYNNHDLGICKVLLGVDDPDNVTENFPLPRPTLDRCILYATLLALEVADTKYADHTIVIGIKNTYVYDIIRNKRIPKNHNRLLATRLLKCMTQMEMSGIDVSFEHVKSDGTELFKVDIMKGPAEECIDNVGDKMDMSKTIKASNDYRLAQIDVIESSAYMKNTCITHKRKKIIKKTKVVINKETPKNKSNVSEPSK